MMDLKRLPTSAPALVTLRSTRHSGSSISVSEPPSIRSFTQLKVLDVALGTNVTSYDSSYPSKVANLLSQIHDHPTLEKFLFQDFPSGLATLKEVANVILTAISQYGAFNQRFCRALVQSTFWINSRDGIVSDSLSYSAYRAFTFPEILTDPQLAAKYVRCSYFDANGLFTGSPSFMSALCDSGKWELFEEYIKSPIVFDKLNSNPRLAEKVLLSAVADREVKLVRELLEKGLAVKYNDMMYRAMLYLSMQPNTTGKAKLTDFDLIRS
jgi:hypothetical protein